MSSKQIRRAAKYYTCVDNSYAHDRMIAPGDNYVRVTFFKSDDLIGGDKPRQIVLCLNCGDSPVIVPPDTERGIEDQVTVYVDDAQIPAQVGRLFANWSHLMADTREELIEFGAKIGMQKRWLQDKRSGVHFDLTESKRKAALQLGAEPIATRTEKWREVVKVARAQHRETHPDCDLMCGQKRTRA